MPDLVRNKLDPTHALHVEALPAEPRWLRLALAGAALAAVLSLALEFGFRKPLVPVALLIVAQLAAVVVYLSYRVLGLSRSATRPQAIRALWIDGILLLVIITIALAGVELTARPMLHVSAVYIAGFQVFILLRIVIAAMRWNISLAQTRLHPTRLLAMSFAGLILLGTFALSLPRATRPDLLLDQGISIPMHVLNCAFTAISATCVTGLVVYDTGSDFTVFGQSVILVLIQLGGLGIMTFGTVVGMLIGQNLSLRHSLLMEDITAHRTLAHVRSAVVFILVATILCELIGAVVLFPAWDGISSPYERAFYSLFHAISAFCNAGFGLYPDSLAQYSRQWQIYGCIAPLIVVGGLGFPVLYDSWRWVVTRGRRFRQRARGVTLRGGTRRAALSLHSKLALSMTVVLVVVPTILFFVLETYRPGVTPTPSGIAWVEPRGSTPLNSDAWLPRLFGSFFLSVTSRTAGFNTHAMDPVFLSPPSHMLTAILMFIGGAPASTAGGAKTICVAVLVLHVWATLRGREEVEVFGRSISEVQVRRCAVVLTILFALNSVVTVALCYTENVSLRVGLFESVSACSTVGLTTGLTPNLTVVGRVIIMFAMFAGRIGPLTLLIALAGKSRPHRYAYPTESVVIG